MSLFFVLGEMMTWSGENASRSSYRITADSEELAIELKSRKAYRTGIGGMDVVGIGSKSD